MLEHTFGFSPVIFYVHFSCLSILCYRRVRTHCTICVHIIFTFFPWKTICRKEEAFKKATILSRFQWISFQSPSLPCFQFEHSNFKLHKLQPKHHKTFKLFWYYKFKIICLSFCDLGFLCFCLYNFFFIAINARFCWLACNVILCVAPI